MPRNGFARTAAADHGATVANLEKYELALVVPALTFGGGVPATALFLAQTAIRAGRYRLKLLSLATAANDPASVQLASPSTWIRGLRSTTGEWNGLSFEHVGALASEMEFQRYRVRKKLKECLSGCGVIQVVCGSPAWANAVVGAGKPVSLHAASLARVERRKRCEEARGVGGWWRRRMTAVTQRLDEEALRRADAIQVMNPWMLDYAIGLNAGREVDIRYAPPGIDSSRFCPAAVRDVERNRYILCVGRLDDPRKNVGLLLEAYALLRTDLKTTVRLVLAGASGPPPALWQRAAALGLTDRVSFVERPHTDELVSLYQRASVLALPSDEEGFGIVLLEAMACGVPVVSTRCGGPDGIVTDGKDGYLVGLDDAAALSDRLGRLLDDPDLNRDMGMAARRKIEATYTQEVAGRVFIETWDALLTRGRVARCAG